MRPLFRVQVLPAGHGDCILLEYGDPKRPRRVLIDGGTTGTWKRLKAKLGLGRNRKQRLDLLVVTHVDADHIGGVLPMLESDALAFDDIWFNGYRHLEEKNLEDQGPVQGEKLTAQLWPRIVQWNKAFGGHAVVIPEDGAPPVVPLPDGMKVTLLSPTREKLRDLAPVWADACREAGVDPSIAPPPAPEGLEAMGVLDVDVLAASAFKEDAKEANGSSIAFVAEFDDRRVLFGADAHPSVLRASIARLGGKLAVDAFKVPHHGSRNNLDSALLDAVDTRRYVVSTNGSYFKHPHREAIARIVHRRVPDCEVQFNYRTTLNECWEDAGLQAQWRYVPVFPTVPDEPLVLAL